MDQPRDTKEGEAEGTREQIIIKITNSKENTLKTLRIDRWITEIMKMGTDIKEEATDSQ